ncbi:MAG: hypothetical protein HZC28_15300 [Spirochaetes bacterium]|nr:hypothetical protein [Spirochaetota bacterium]
MIKRMLFLSVVCAAIAMPAPNVAADIGEIDGLWYNVSGSRNDTREIQVSLQQRYIIVFDAAADELFAGRFELVANALYADIDIIIERSHQPNNVGKRIKGVVKAERNDNTVALYLALARPGDETRPANFTASRFGRYYVLSNRATNRTKKYEDYERELARPSVRNEERITGTADLFDIDGTWNSGGTGSIDREIKISYADRTILVYDPSAGDLFAGTFELLTNQSPMGIDVTVEMSVSNKLGKMKGIIRTEGTGRVATITLAFGKPGDDARPERFIYEKNYRYYVLSTRVKTKMNKTYAEYARDLDSYQGRSSYSGSSYRRKGNSFTTYLMPGFSGGAYWFMNQPRMYAGGDFHFNFINALRDNAERSSDLAGRYSIYAEFGFYHNFDVNTNATLFFTYLLGFDISFESPASLSRNMFIPYYGMKAGGININNRGNGLFVTPLLGLSIIDMPKLSVKFDVSFTLSTIDFYNFLGVNPRLYCNFLF